MRNRNTSRDVYGVGAIRFGYATLANLLATFSAGLIARWHPEGTGNTATWIEGWWLLLADFPLNRKLGGDRGLILMVRPLWGFLRHELLWSYMAVPQGIGPR